MNINGTSFKIQNQFSSLTQLFTKKTSAHQQQEFNPEEWKNTNGMTGMYIGGGKQWKKTIDVSDESKENLAKVVKEDFIATNGSGIPSGSKRNDVIVQYLGTISADKRSSASWTLDRMAGDYAARLEDAVRKNHPGWKPGEAFDTSILDQVDGSLGLHYQV